MIHDPVIGVQLVLEQIGLRNDGLQQEDILMPFPKDDSARAHPHQVDVLILDGLRPGLGNLLMLRRDMAEVHGPDTARKQVDQVQIGNAVIFWRDLHS